MGMLEDLAGQCASSVESNATFPGKVRARCFRGAQTTHSLKYRGKFVQAANKRVAAENALLRKAFVSRCLRNTT
jgi:hypothetical protein